MHNEVNYHYCLSQSRARLPEKEKEKDRKRKRGGGKVVREGGALLRNDFSTLDTI